MQGRWSVAVGKLLVGLLIAGLLVLAVAAPASAGKPKSGDWFSDPVDPEDESNLSSVQFKVAGGKKLKKVTIFWRCGTASGYHNFSNPPIPIGISKQKKFKLVGATTPPSGQPTKDFTLKGTFLSAKKAKYSMKLENCGPKTKGKLNYAA